MVAADLVVLAITTLKIAMIEEDITNPSLAADGRLFALMQADGSNRRSVADTAISHFPQPPACAALAWAGVARHIGCAVQMVHDIILP